MKLALAAVLALVLLGAASPGASLVAGSVRDQHGAPVRAALVTIRDGVRVVGTALTADDGTFIFDGFGSDAVVTCRFCRPARVTIGSDGIAIAVVTRYDALALDGPSTNDLSALPYAGPAQLLELVPFVVVNETARTIPGTSATDRNATPYGGLLVLDGAPDYDVTAGTTPFDTLAQGGASELHVLRTDEAYRYGGIAQGGTFVFDTPAGTSHAATGSDTLLRAAFDAEDARAAATFSNARAGIRAQRASADLDVTMPGALADLQLSSGSGYDTPGGASGLFSSFSSVSAGIRTRRGIPAYARVIADRGTYAYTSPRFPDSSTWSDDQFEAGVTSNAYVAPFATFSVRQSSGSYISSATGSDPVAGALSQARITAGVTHHSDALDATLATGATDIGFTGITGSPPATPATARDAVASVTYRPSDRWSLHASASSGYTLQTFPGIYVPPSIGYPPANPVLDGHTNEATVEFNDTSRLRIAATALAWGGAGGARTASAGASVGWQIAPNLSLRTWVLHESASAWNAGDVGTAWISYGNRDAFRLDAVLARSLLDHSPKNHLDAAISGRLTDRIDWFVSSAYVGSAQSTAVGIRVR